MRSNNLIEVTTPTYIGSPTDQYRSVAPPYARWYDRLMEKSLSLAGMRGLSKARQRADLFVTLCTIHSFMVGSARVFLSFIRCKT